MYMLCLPAVSGTLKGYDQLLNLVLDEAVEYIRGNVPKSKGIYHRPILVSRLRLHGNIFEHVCKGLF